ncbi:TniB family NTP-binding protein [Roseomonas aeriglobus]|nr:TniB family NTP-binding protein [Roseomonas aeriglobus]
MNNPKDPYGIQPEPARGDRLPDYSDRARAERVKLVVPFFKTNYIEHQPQTDRIEELLDYIDSMQPLLGRAIDGRRLSEYYSAGKSRMVERMIEVAAERRAANGLPPNPYQILWLELDKTTSVATFYRQALRLMGDDHWDGKAKLDELEDRMEHFARRLGVEGMVGDEVQHLGRKTTDAKQVTDRFKTFLNRGVLPLILVGDETSEAFFDENEKFAARLGTPLTLKPLDVRHSGRDKRLFLEFCGKLDASLVAGGITDELSGLDKRGLRTPLAIVSGGHVGRVCRLVCEAAQHAIRRGAGVIEAHDLSVATRNYAFRVKFIRYDPFSKPHA